MSGWPSGVTTIVLVELREKASRAASLMPLTVGGSMTEVLAASLVLLVGPDPVIVQFYVDRQVQRKLDLIDAKLDCLLGKD